MSDRTSELTCGECGELAPELALDVLVGRERAAALAHLSRCARCQDDVSARTTTATRLVELLPEVTPPPGFEERVLAAIIPPTAEAPVLAAAAPTGAQPPVRREHRHRPLRPLLLTAVVLTVALVAGDRWVAGQAARGGPLPSPVPSPAVRPVAEVVEAPLMSGEHQIGTAYVYSQDPSWVLVSVAADDADGDGAPDSSRPAELNCVLVRQDGTTVPVGSFALDHGHAAWVMQTSVNPHSLIGAALTAGNGDTIARANFTQNRDRDRSGRDRDGDGDRGGDSDRGDSDRHDHHDQHHHKKHHHQKHDHQNRDHEKRHHKHHDDDHHN